MGTLHGVNGSPFVRKVRAAFAEKGVEYEQVPVMPMGQTPEYFAISPLGKVPCYTDGEFALPDSSCIIAYLEKSHPKPALYPSDAKEFGRALWYEEYHDTKVIETLAPVFFQRFVRKNLMGQDPDEALVQKHLTELAPPVFDYLEKEIGDRKWLVGRQFSIADLAMGSIFVNLKYAGEQVDASRWPNLAAYVERVHSRPSYKGIIEEELAGAAE